VNQLNIPANSPAMALLKEWRKIINRVTLDTQRRIRREQRRKPK
jgi:hypothetical protein